jgi:DNA (cytosine-5)-methyltransferase 1
LKIATLFAGAGGFDYGFKKAGFTTLWANEFDKTIWETYSTNFPETILNKNSIIDVDSFEIPDIDGIIGSPPCQSWSAAGKKEGINDPRGQLFYEFIRILRDVQPKFFIAENVAGMLTKKNQEAFNIIKKHFEDSGYRLSIHLLDAHNYNVPQNRKRVFFIGYRDDLNKTFSFPEPILNKPVLKDAIFDLKEKAIPNSNTEHGYLTGSFSSMYMSRNRVRSWDEPSFTIQASGRHCPIHPQAPKMPLVKKDIRTFAEGQEHLYRRFTIREVARIQTFPDSFKFVFNKQETAYKMIGNAVPVNLAYELAKKIKEDLFS